MLEEAPIVLVSARERTCLEELASAIAARLPLAGSAAASALVGALPAVGASSPVSGRGVVLDLTTKRGEGAALHVLLRDGDLR